MIALAGGASADWGDVPTWVGAAGALAAFGWAVFLYAGSVRDQRRAQARLLAPVGGAVPVVDLPGSPVRAAGTAPPGFLALNAQKQLVTTAALPHVTVHLVSTSDETFTGIRAWLDLDDGSSVRFPLGFEAMAPHADETAVVYFEDNVVRGNMRVRIQFQDANGRWWERSNATPLRRLRKAPSAPRS